MMLGKVSTVLLRVMTLLNDIAEELLDDSQLIMQCVSIIAKVDYDLIQPFVHMIVPLLIQVCTISVILAKCLTVS